MQGSAYARLQLQVSLSALHIALIICSAANAHLLKLALSHASCHLIITSCLSIVACERWMNSRGTATQAANCRDHTARCIVLFAHAAEIFSMHIDA